VQVVLNGRSELLIWFDILILSLLPLVRSGSVLRNLSHELAAHRGFTRLEVLELTWSAVLLSMNFLG
jgi:hypothetical protein